MEEALPIPCPVRAILGGADPQCQPLQAGGAAFRLCVPGSTRAHGTEFNSDVETSWLIWEVSCSWTGGVAGVGVVVELGPGLGQTGRV